MRYSPDGFAKDPAVIRFGGKYYLYHSARIPGDSRLRIGICVSDTPDFNGTPLYLPIDSDCEAKGHGAPCAIVLGGKVHLFYQTYGNMQRDAICHAVSDDGIHFIKDSTNPVFRPTDKSCCGRAIDADVCVFGNRLLLYFATRDKAFEKQMTGVAVAPLNSSFSRDDFICLSEDVVLRPELPWEGNCIEAPATIVKDGKVWLFYGGNYNCRPQCIGLCSSSDGIHFNRESTEPFFRNGKTGSWNESESGHPYVFEDDDGRIYLYFQGSPDGGKNWILSRMELSFNGNGFAILNVFDEPEDKTDGEKITVKLSEWFGDTPMSRAQAKRLCHRLDSFKEAVIDFEGTEWMGQGFAHQLFVVFPNNNPGVVLIPENMNEDVRKMYRHVLPD